MERLGINLGYFLFQVFNFTIIALILYSAAYKPIVKMLEERKITLDLDVAARQWLADAGYDPVYGARPLKRIIQTHLQNPLATMLLEGRIPSGGTLRVTAKDSGLVINGRKAEAA